MSWTQGIQVREDCTENQIKNLDKIGLIKFGDGYKFTAFVWDETDKSVLFIDYQNEETKEYRSLRWNIKE